MDKIICACIIGLLLLTQSFKGYGQENGIRWSNKSNGTFTIYPHSSGTTDTMMCSISIRMYELSEIGCTKISGKIKLNGKLYDAYDSSDFVNRDGYKDRNKILYLDLKPGVYSVKAFVNNHFYKVKTGQLELKGANIYNFNFYLIRKKKLKRNS